MALTWDVGKIHDYKNVTTVIAPEDDPSIGVKKGQELWSPVTTSLVWLTIATGIGEITKDNADEVYARVALVERLHGAYLIRDGKERYITPEEVHAHIGLVTNVFPTETRAKFLKRQAGNYLDDKQKQYAKQATEAVAA